MKELRFRAEDELAMMAENVGNNMNRPQLPVHLQQLLLLVGVCGLTLTDTSGLILTD